MGSEREGCARDERATELLSTWERSLREQAEAAFAELCAAHPDLAHDLRRRRAEWKGDGPGGRIGLRARPMARRAAARRPAARLATA